MNELEQLVAAQAHDDRYGHRVHGGTVNALTIQHLATEGRDGLPALELRPLLAHDDRHGTLYCYKRLSCRCRACKTVSAAWQKAYRRRQAA